MFNFLKSINLRKKIKNYITIIDGEKVYGSSLGLNCLKLNSLQSYNLSDVIVTGDFYCYSNNLTSLKGSPKKVYGNFYCCGNNLTSLEGLPETIGGKIIIEKPVLQKLYFTNDFIAVYDLQDKFLLL